MSFLVPKSEQKKDHGRIGEGTYPARVVQIIGLGRQENINFKTKQPMLNDKGEPQPPTNKVLITYELPTETIEIGDEQKPRWMSKEYNLFFSENAGLTKVLVAAAEGSDDLENLLSKSCLLTVGTTSGGKDKITAVSPMMKGMDVAELSNDPVIFNFDDPDLGVYNKLFDWQKNKMQEAVNFKGSKLEYKLGADYAEDAEADAKTDSSLSDEGFSDDIPF